MKKDLVCGMQVDEKYPPAKIYYRGQEYVFCSQACLEAFKQNPDQYIRNAEKEDSRENEQTNS